MKGYFDSLLPYFEQPEQLTETLAKAKTAEAIALLLRTPHLRNLLFDFNKPFKIDLEAYMNCHFTYNVSLAAFAKATGRSLSTFKRDFAKTFDTSPEKWLKKQRLKHAHYLIAQQQQRPSEVYLAVGFENLSHFSESFKKQFGYSPSHGRRRGQQLYPRRGDGEYHHIEPNEVYLPQPLLNQVQQAVLHRSALEELKQAANLLRKQLVGSLHQPGRYKVLF